MGTVQEPITDLHIWSNFLAVYSKIWQKKKTLQIGIESGPKIEVSGPIWNRPLVYEISDRSRRPTGFYVTGCDASCCINLGSERGSVGVNENHVHPIIVWRQHDLLVPPHVSRSLAMKKMNLMFRNARVIMRQLPQPRSLNSKNPRKKLTAVLTGFLFASLLGPSSKINCLQKINSSNNLQL